MVKPWKKALLNGTLTFAICLWIGAVIGTVIDCLDNETTPPERISTQLVDDGKYLVIYKQKVEGETIYAPVFLDKGDANEN